MPAKAASRMVEISGWTRGGGSENNGIVIGVGGKIPRSVDSVDKFETFELHANVTDKATERQHRPQTNCGTTKWRRYFVSEKRLMLVSR